jgi:hypothetical protein
MPPSSGTFRCRSRSTSANCRRARAAAGAAAPVQLRSGVPVRAVDRYRRGRLHLPRDGTTPFHATHIALYEIARRLLGHQHSAAWDQLVSLLAPDVDAV